MASNTEETGMTKKKNTFIVGMIYLITADKGGTGKSFVARVIIDGLIAAGIAFELMECDVGIPDTGRIFGEKASLDVDTPEGWRKIYDGMLAAPKDKPLIITMPGGFLNRARTHMPAILSVLPHLPEHLGRPLRVVWVGDDKRDVVQSMHSFRKETGSKLTIDFVKNEKFCPSDQFRFFDASEERQILTKNGGQILYLPSLAYRSAQMMTNNRVKGADMTKIPDLLDRVEFEQWWAKTIKIFRDAGYVP